jgi:O-antigen ligase/polysaccharide polymerase Wzy-like membrane protein
MGSTAVTQPSWTVAPGAPRVFSTVWLFRSLLGFAFCISFFVLVEPAPVDGLLIALFVFGLFFGIVRIRRMPVLPVVLLTGLAVANLVSMLGADDPVRATFYTFVTFYMMTSWALFVGAVDFYGASVLKTVFVGYSVAVMLAVVPAIASYFHLIGFQSVLLLFGRPKGLFKDPNVYGPFLVLIGVMAITGCLPVANRFVQLVMAVTASLGIALSYSRACWINYSVSLVLFAVLDQILPSHAPEGRSTSFRQLVGFAILAILTLAAVSQIPAVKTMLAVRLGQGGMQGYDQIRFQTQQLAVRAAIEHPLGIGPGQSEGTFTYATHSSFVRVLGENGLLGLFCFVSFLIATLVQAIAQASRAQSRQWRSIYLAAAACICGHLINSGVVDTVHWRHFWFLLALPWAPNSVVAAHRAFGRIL